MGKIYEHNFLYSFLRPYVDFCTRHSFSQIGVIGEENLPKDGVVIFAPNHCNTLMDALVVLQARSGSTVFGARADIFDNEIAAKCLHFLRILPMVRKRDGLRNVLKNHESIKSVVETLDNGVPFCVFSEGTHRPKHSLMPISKGIVRIALDANEKIGHNQNVYIVPVGLEYGDYFRYRSTVLLQYGKPINITDKVNEASLEVTEGSLGSMELYNGLRKLIGDNISGLITYLEDDELYAPKWTLVKLANLRVKGNLKYKLDKNREVAAALERAEAQKPGEMAVLYEMADALEKERLNNGISILSFGRTGRTNIIIKFMAVLLGLPYFVFSTITTLPLWLTSTIIRRKTKDRAFHNTVIYGTKLLLTPVILIIWGLVFFLVFRHHWVASILLTLLVLPAHGYFYDYREYVRRWFSDIALRREPALIEYSKQIKERLKDILEQ